MEKEPKPKEEQALINAFVVPSKRERFCGFVADPRKRDKLIRTLSHFSDFDPRYVVSIPRSEQDARSILRLLREHGAGPHCYSMSAQKNTTK